MAYKIPDGCIVCGTCETECPNKAISEGEPNFIINPNKCTECVGYFDSPRCVETCPLHLPCPDPEHQETKKQLLEKWYKLHPGEVPKVSGGKVV